MTGQMQKGDASLRRLFVFLVNGGVWFATPACSKTALLVFARFQRDVRLS